MPARRARSRVLDVLLGGVLDLAVLVSVLLAAFLLYGFVVMPALGDRREAEAAAALEAAWGGGETASAPLDAGELADGGGDGPYGAFATIEIPRLGRDWRYTIVPGVGIPDLRTGVGWYPGTGLPGRVGNFAVAAHRDGSTAPFMHIDRLRTCDPIIVDTRAGSYTYRVVPVDSSPAEQAEFRACAPGAADTRGVPGRHLTSPQDLSVLNPTPTRDGAADQPWMTLTSCHPRLSAAQRIIVHAVLVDHDPR